MNKVFAPKNMKIVHYSKGSASWPLFRHGGTGGLIVFFWLLIRRGGIPPGVAAFIVPEEQR